MCLSNRSEQNTVKVEKRFSTWNAQKCSDNFLPNSSYHDLKKNCFGKSFTENIIAIIEWTSVFSIIKFEAFTKFLDCIFNL